MALATKQPQICHRCGGQVLHFTDGIFCPQCSAPHTKEGRLETCSTRELSLRLPEKRLQIPSVAYIRIE